MEGPMREAFEEYQLLYAQAMTVPWWRSLRQRRLSKAVDGVYERYKREERLSWGPLP